MAGCGMGYASRVRAYHLKFYLAISLKSTCPGSGLPLCHCGATARYEINRITRIELVCQLHPPDDLGLTVFALSHEHLWLRFARFDRVRAGHQRMTNLQMNVRKNTR